VTEAQPEFLSARWRAISAAEFVVGAAIVIGHNVFRVVPNEVPILFVLGMLSVRIRDGRWSAIGLKRPDSWWLIIGIAVSAAAIRLLLGSFVIEPVAAHFWPPIQAPAGAEKIAGNIKVAGMVLALIWTFAAFGEEISYRGYLTLRASEGLRLFAPLNLEARNSKLETDSALCANGKQSMTAFWIATVLVSVLFGYGHYYKGPAGVIDSAMAGLILGVAYLIAKRNLWAAVIAHGLIDTVAVVAAFMGYD
jgi:CAAX protease family protein